MTDKEKLIALLDEWELPWFEWTVGKITIGDGTPAPEFYFTPEGRYVNYGVMTSDPTPPPPHDTEWREWLE